MTDPKLLQLTPEDKSDYLEKIKKVDENDEIPDSIPDYGYLDDIKVVEWVLNDVRDQVPFMPRA